MKIKGKTLSITQRNALMKAGMPAAHINEWLLQKSKFISSDGGRPSKLKSKKEVYEIIHRETGETKEVVIREV